MTTPTDTGGSPISSYRLEWNQGDGSTNFVTLAGSLATEYLLSTSVTMGTTYSFRLVAQNKWGESQAGSSINIQASSLPGQISSVITSVSGSNVRLTWTQP